MSDKEKLARLEAVQREISALIAEGRKLAEETGLIFHVSIEDNGGDDYARRFEYDPNWRDSYAEDDGARGKWVSSSDYC